MVVKRIAVNQTTQVTLCVCAQRSMNIMYCQSKVDVKVESYNELMSARRKQNKTILQLRSY